MQCYDDLKEITGQSVLLHNTGKQETKRFPFTQCGYINSVKNL